MSGVIDQLARMGAAGLADSLVLGFAVAAIVWATLGLLRRNRAATRFVVLAIALAAVAILPLLRAFTRIGTGAASSPLILLGDSWAMWFGVIWAAGAMIGLARLAIGLIRLRQIHRGARPFSLAPELLETVHEFSPSRRVDFLASDAVSAPCAMGFIKPAVVLPSWAVDELSIPELRHILIHELSHLQRRDDWTTLLQRVIQALFFFHPAVWWIENRLSLEREMACDDAVLAHSTSPRAYAECLARLAEKSMLRRGLALAQAAVSRMRQTSRRVARILRFDAAVRGSRVAVSFAAVLALTGFGALLDAPTLISFAPLSAAASAAPSSVTLASSWQFRRHLAGPLDATNASWRIAPQDRATVHASNAPSTMHSVVAQDQERHKPAAVRAVAKHLAPPVRALRASLNSDSAHEVTYLLVLQDRSSVTVWQISTWQFVPSRKVRADRKTT